jgi:hypothetical protein
MNVELEVVCVGGQLIQTNRMERWQRVVSGLYQKISMMLLMLLTTGAMMMSGRFYVFFLEEQLMLVEINRVKD